MFLGFFEKNASNFEIVEKKFSNPDTAPHCQKIPLARAVI